MDLTDDPLRIPIRDLNQPMVDLRCTRRVEDISVKIERARLKRSLEDIGDVCEQDIVEEVAELCSRLESGLYSRIFHSCFVCGKTHQRPHNTPLRVISLPSMITVPT